MEIENATRATLTSVEGQVVHALYDIAICNAFSYDRDFRTVAAGFGLVPGLIFGLKRG